jgi:large repetitive protein
MSSARRLLVPVMLLTLAADAEAQDRSYHFDLQSFHAASTSGGLITLEGTEIGTHLRPRGSVQLLYLHNPLIYEVGTASIEGVRSRLGAEIALGMGLWNRVEVAVALPVVIYQDGQDTGLSQTPASAGIGDLRLVPKVRVFGNPLGGLSLSMVVGGRIPTAQDDGFAGAGWAFEPSALLGYRRGSFSLHGLIGYRLQAERRLFNLVVDDQILVGAGATYRWRGFSALAELNAAAEAASPFTSRQRTPVLAMLGARYTRRGLSVTVSGGPGLVPGFGSPTVQVGIAVGYAPWGVDSDGDGIPDDRDVCPLEREDRDGFEDFDGCPDPDNDRDGIPDVLDRCPNEPEDKDGFEDEDGCPDPDNDRDGIPDARDRCPNEPEDRDGFEDEDGCPDPDNDLDGIPDKDDKCPDTPGTLTGPGHHDGCPAPDRDHDGIPDDVDKCPDEPEDKDGFQDDDGCPDPDNDGDGIPDAKDKCPDEPETVNGYQDDDGCPDEVKPRVVLKRQILWTSEAIYFDPGKWVIRARFRPILKKIAETITASKKIHVVYVEGHTDEQGDEVYNQWLSFYRAEEVLLALRKLGVPRGKVRAMGRGPDRPEEPEPAHLRNRRVVFHVEHKEPRLAKRPRPASTPVRATTLKPPPATPLAPPTPPAAAKPATLLAPAKPATPPTSVDPPKPATPVEPPTPARPRKPADPEDGALKDLGSKLKRLERLPR